MNIIRTTRTSRLLTIVLLAAVPSLSAACGPGASANITQNTGSALASNGIDAKIVKAVSLAETHLKTVEGDEEGISAAVEVASALHASGNSSAAKSLINSTALKARVINDAALRADALLKVTRVLIKVGDSEAVTSILAQAKSAADELETETKRWDLIAKLAAVYALHDDDAMALNTATQIPVSDDTLASYKARAIQEIAPIQANQNKLNNALHTLTSINMGLVYYRATARSDVAIIAHNKGDSDTAASLLQAARDLSYAQTDGYFVAGSLRHIAVVYAEIGDDINAVNYFSEALKSARKGKSPQHQARAISRVATSLADVGLFDRAVAALPSAVQIAESESKDAFRFWAFYEIAGSAAFSGDFLTAIKVLQAIPSSFKFGKNSLRSAAQRDVAWGLARHERSSEALALALNIESPRERVQALSRIARVLVDPKMKALPRYL